MRSREIDGKKTVQRAGIATAWSLGDGLLAGEEKLGAIVISAGRR